MESKLIILGVFLCLNFTCLEDRALAVTSIPSGYIEQTSDFDILVTTPPIQVYVEDSQGNITGADPSISVDQYGIQGNFKGGLAEIPLSCVSQENNADQNGIPDNHTGWNMDFEDGGSQTYKIYLKGISSAATTIYMGAVYPKNSGKPGLYSPFVLFATPNVLKEVDVTFDPTQNTIVPKPILSNADLLTDVKSACAQDLIDPRDCEFLTDKAELIEKALDDKHNREARKLLKSFLCNLGESKGEGDDDRDYHNAIKEPALDILIEDAEELLNTIHTHKDYDQN